MEKITTASPVITSKIILRDTLSEMILLFWETFQKHGIFKIGPMQSECSVERFEDAFEKFCTSMGCPVEQRSKTNDVSFHLDRRQFDKMILECALILSKRIPYQISDYESMGMVRALVIEMLRRLGYLIPRSYYSHSKARWWCYREWEQVAIADGFTDEAIRLMRSTEKNSQPEHYEE